MMKDHNILNKQLKFKYLKFSISHLNLNKQLKCKILTAWLHAFVYDKSHLIRKDEHKQVKLPTNTTQDNSNKINFSFMHVFT